MELTTKHIKRIAKLSRIGCDEFEIESLKEDLAKIFDMVEELNEVDITLADQIISESSTIFHMREDRVMHDISVEDILANAPKKEFNCFVVRRVIE